MCACDTTPVCCTESVAQCPLAPDLLLLLCVCVCRSHPLQLAARVMLTRSRRRWISRTTRAGRWRQQQQQHEAAHSAVQQLGGAESGSLPLQQGPAVQQHYYIGSAANTSTVATGSNEHLKGTEKVHGAASLVSKSAAAAAAVHNSYGDDDGDDDSDIFYPCPEVRQKAWEDELLYSEE